MGNRSRVHTRVDSPRRDYQSNPQGTDKSPHPDVMCNERWRHKDWDYMGPVDLTAVLSFLHTERRDRPPFARDSNSSVYARAHGRELTGRIALDMDLDTFAVCRLVVLDIPSWSHILDDSWVVTRYSLASMCMTVTH